MLKALLRIALPAICLLPTMSSCSDDPNQLSAEEAKIAGFWDYYISDLGEIAYIYLADNHTCAVIYDGNGYSGKWSYNAIKKHLSTTVGLDCTITETSDNSWSAISSTGESLHSFDRLNGGTRSSRIFDFFDYYTAAVAKQMLNDYSESEVRSALRSGFKRDIYLSDPYVRGSATLSCAADWATEDINSYNANIEFISNDYGETRYELIISKSVPFRVTSSSRNDYRKGMIVNYDVSIKVGSGKVDKVEFAASESTLKLSYEADNETSITYEVQGSLKDFEQGIAVDRYGNVIFR